MSIAAEELRGILAVAYLGEGDSEERVRSWAEDHGYLLIGTISPSGSRDAPSRVLELCRGSGARTILVRDLSVLGEDLETAYAALRKIYEAGISIVFTERNLRIDGRTALGRLIMEALSMALEARGGRGEAQQTRRTGRPPRQIAESELLELRNRGMSVRAIARALDVSKSTVWRKLKELESRKG